MIVAGIGCKKGVPADRIIAAIDAALNQHGAAREQLGLLASGDLKRGEAGLIAASTKLNVPLMIIDASRLQAVAPRCLTQSPASIAATGLPSLSEAAAIVAAGNGGVLLGPRLSFDGVTCALGMPATATRKDAP